MSTATDDSTAHRPATVGVEQGGRARGLSVDIVTIMTSSLVTSALGFVFWTFAARGYSTAEVGRASALISSSTLLATLANLSLGGLYERFLPIAGASTRRMVALGQCAIVAAAAVFGTVFVFLGPSEQLFDHTVERVLFPVAVMILAIFAIQDSLLIGLGHPRFVAIKNVTQSTAKLVLVAAFIPLATGTAIIGSWVLPATVIATWMGVSAIRKAARRATGPGSMPPASEIGQFFAGSFVITAVGVAVPLILPLIIVARLGTEMNAYFSLCWLVVTTVAILINATGAPFVSAAAEPDTDRRAATIRFIVLCSSAGVVGCIGLIVAAPLVLGILGARYAAQGTGLIQLMALALPAVALITIYTNLSRVERRLRLAVATQILFGLVVIASAAPAADRWDLTGVAYVYLAANLVVALVLLVPTIRAVRRALSTPPAPRDAPGEPARLGPDPGPARATAAPLLDPPPLLEPLPPLEPLPVEPLRPVDPDATVADRFHEMADRRGRMTALRAGDATLSYAELSDRARSVGATIDEIAGTTGPVILQAGLQTSTVAAALGVFTTHRPLVALDPQLPAQRVDGIIDALCGHGRAPAMTIADDEHRDVASAAASAHGFTCHALDELIAARPSPTGIPSSGATAVMEHRGHRDSVTSIQFTSGSTGAPKGVLHPNGMWLCDAQLMRDGFGLGEGRRVALCLPISFGAGLNVLIGSLLCGAEVIAADPRVLGPATLLDTIADSDARTAFLTPSLLRALIGEDDRRATSALAGLERIITTGEPLAADLARRARSVAPQAVITNWIGSSETSALAYHDLRPTDPIPSDTVPAGHPAPHKSIRVDDDGRMTVSSPYLALGYLDPEHDHGRFDRDDGGIITFRSGDRARFDDGVLHLLGRLADAVKIRGYLVEPAEVERALLRDGDLEEVVVTARSVHTGAELIAHVVPSGQTRTPSAAALRQRLRGRLPDWMVPAHIVVLSQLPRTPRGKVDRTALPAPQRGPIDPPQSPLEHRIAEVWATVLGLDAVGRTENINELGGDSLSVQRILAELSARDGLVIHRSDAAAAPTVAEMAALADPDDIVNSSMPLSPTTVRLRSAAGRPLFCFAGAGASALAFVALSNRVAGDVGEHLGIGPVYAFQANGLGNRGIPDWTVGAAARRHLRDLRRIQPSGPYLVAGHSLGGFVALEVARRLRSAGEEVELVVVIDTFLPPRLAALRTLPDPDPAEPALRPSPEGYVSPWPEISRRELWLRRLRLPLAGLVHGTPTEVEKALEEVGVRVSRTHRPKPYDGAVLLIHSSENHDDPGVWRAHVVHGELDVVRLDCDHGSIVRDPHISDVVDAVVTRIDRARKGTDSARSR